MQSAIAIAVTLTFAVLAAWHFRMAALPGIGGSGAVPTVAGKPLFVPPPAATVAVGVVLLGCAALVSAAADIWQSPLPRPLLMWLSYGLASGLLLRAIGDFRYVGFFKRVRDSRFATLDSFVYSPLCLLLAAGVVASARTGVA